MDADERRRTEAAMAKISRAKREVEADPAAAMQASLDASMAKFKRRLLHILFWVMLVAALAVLIYMRRRG
jgi:hypothetical protein